MYRLIKQNYISEFPSKHSVSGNPQLWNSQARYIPTSPNFSKDSEILSTALETQFHTHSSFSISKAFPTHWTPNLEVFFQHLHYMSVVQNTLSHMETRFLELFSSQLQREPHTGFKNGTYTGAEEHTSQPTSSCSLTD